MGLMNLQLYLFSVAGRNMFSHRHRFGGGGARGCMMNAQKLPSFRGSKKKIQAARVYLFLLADCSLPP